MCWRTRWGAAGRGTKQGGSEGEARKVVMPLQSEEFS